jgi:SAM-dependent methyltransferase
MSLTSRHVTTDTDPMSGDFINEGHGARLCLLCGSSRIGDETQSYVTCRECLTISMKTPLEASENLANSHVYERAVDRRDKRVFAKLNGFAGTPGSLLDLGCGNGAFLQLALDNGWRGRGVDGAPALADSAKAQGTPVELCDLDQWKRRDDDIYDAVRLWYTLEHVAKPGRLVRLALESLKPGGVLLVGVPNDATPLCRKLMESPADRYWENRLHLHHYPPFGLERFLESLGLTIAFADVALPSELLRSGTIPFASALKHAGELEEAWEKGRDAAPQIASVFYKLGVGRSREVFFIKTASP